MTVEFDIPPKCPRLQNRRMTGPHARPSLLLESNCYHQQGWRYIHHHSRTGQGKVDQGTIPSQFSVHIQGHLVQHQKPNSRIRAQKDRGKGEGQRRAKAWCIDKGVSNTNF